MASKNVTVPDLGGAADVTVIEILVKPGDKIEAEAPIVTLESDKATMEVPTTSLGVVKEIKVKVGDKVATGSILITLDSDVSEESDEATDVQTKAVSQEKSEKDKAPSLKEEKQPKEASQKRIVSKDEDKEAAKSTAAQVLSGTVQTTDVHAGPGVRRLAREFGVNLALVPGSGPKQRILKEDVQLFVKGQLTQVQTSPSGFPFLPNQPIDFSQFGPTETEALSRIKKISGKNLQRNWVMIPHVTQFGEADITNLEEFRQSQKAQLEKQEIKMSPLVFVMKASVAALKAFPHFNASLDAAGENLIVKKYFHLGVAVDTPEGLLVPVIRDVDKKGLVELAKELALVSEKARKKQLTPRDMQGGSFSISSLGGIGGTAFTPIINAPEVAILGVSKTSYKPVYHEGEFRPRLTLPLSLSYDHRVIDGAEGAHFMVYLTEMLSDIRNLLL